MYIKLYMYMYKCFLQVGIIEILCQINLRNFIINDSLCQDLGMFNYFMIIFSVYFLICKDIFEVGEGYYYVIFNIFFRFGFM